MHLTQHASMRRVQRNIPLAIIETILTFGSVHYTEGSAVRVLFDKSSIALAVDGCEHSLPHLERYLGTYLVVGDEGKIVTVARRNRRLFN